MRIIKQSYKILFVTPHILHIIEKAGRICYKSENKMTEGSAIRFTEMLRDRGHHAMLEFGDIIVKFITNRGVTHELVRHRLCSFAQESTRYVDYQEEMEFIMPVWINQNIAGEEKYRMWIAAIEHAEYYYKELREMGWRPEQAREVLPNSLKTEIVVKANTREWRHILQLRCSNKSHPQMHALMRPLHQELKKIIPVLYDDIKY